MFTVYVLQWPSKNEMLASMRRHRNALPFPAAAKGGRVSRWTPKTAQDFRLPYLDRDFVPTDFGGFAAFP
jgi:hypothetical protein